MHRSTERARRLNSLPVLTLIAAVVTATGHGSLHAQEPSADAGQAKSMICASCHGADGNSVTPQWPSLAGQHPAYTVRQLEAYRDGQRTDPGMQQYVATLSEQDMQDIAAYFAGQSIAVKGADPAQVERGERIYRGGIPDRGIAACIACHGPDGKGNLPAGYPRISHQHAPYLATTLRAYRSGDRTSDTELNQMMRNVAELLTDDEIDALANYMQGLD